MYACPVFDKAVCSEVGFACILDPFCALCLGLEEGFHAEGFNRLPPSLVEGELDGVW